MVSLDYETANELKGKLDNLFDNGSFKEIRKEVKDRLLTIDLGPPLRAQFDIDELKFSSEEMYNLLESTATNVMSTLDKPKDVIGGLPVDLYKFDKKTNDELMKDKKNHLTFTLSKILGDLKVEDFSDGFDYSTFVEGINRVVKEDKMIKKYIQFKFGKEINSALEENCILNVPIYTKDQFVDEMVATVSALLHPEKFKIYSLN